MADAEFSSMGNADSSNVKGPLDVIYIELSILFFLFSSRSTEADPDVEKMQRSSGSTPFTLQKTFVPSTMSLWWKETNAQPFLRPSAYCAVQILVFCRGDGIIDKETGLFVSPAQLSRRHVKAGHSVNFIRRNNADFS